MPASQGVIFYFLFFILCFFCRLWGGVSYLMWLIRDLRDTVAVEI